MDINRPMTLLLLEDNETECEILKNYVDTKDNVRFTGITNSSSEALEMFKTYTPERHYCGY